ncbi:hypothetical protein M8I34_17285 [Streptomyces sp. MCA2]|uniref:hypothetical protein n=1 Tax=Streptomyces sp. MCA2 TaxID=2944805 RepID=UPI0020225EE9|nr:hypothetical protein [Streptomyces sp. MCA2]MCL7493149.1 hypothetical protein [Streptomyces sp. MCA2]
MVETVLQIIMQMASGAAATAGTEMGQNISTMVRDRLGGTDRGSTALRAVEDRPEDPAAVDELRALLQAEVDADPEFAESIAAALAAPAAAEPTRTTIGSITLQGTTVRGRNTFSLGSVTFNNTRNVRLSLLAAALVFLALVALGIYGGAQLIVGDDPAHRPTATTSGQADPGSANFPRETGKATPEAVRPTPTDSSRNMEGALLGTSDVPEHWVKDGWADFPRSTTGPCDALKDGLPNGSSVSNTFGSGAEGVQVGVTVYSDQVKAEKAMAWLRTKDEKCLGGRSAAVTPRGDETVGYQYAGYSVIYIRDGKYLVDTMSSGDVPHGLTGYFARMQYEKFTKVLR